MLKAPFPWFGGKSRAAGIIWTRLGDVGNYVEPFAGSLAVLLNRPTTPGNEIVNDLDCYVANAWRAVKFAPEQVSEHCDWPVNEADLHARHRWLHGRTEFRQRMEHDPDFYDVRIAGFWIWGLSCWIGDNFCRPNRNNSVPHLTGGQGEEDKIDVSRKIPYLDAGGRGAHKQSANLLEWFNALAHRLRFTKVCCGDWARVLTKASTYGQGLTGVLLDPPYDAGDSHDDVYGDMSRGVSGKVREWALANGDNPLLRIAICGYDDEHDMPAAWDCVKWKASGGYASAAGNGENSARERIWFSPHCLKDNQIEMFK